MNILLENEKKNRNACVATHFCCLVIIDLSNALFRHLNSALSTIPKNLILMHIESIIRALFCFVRSNIYICNDYIRRVYIRLVLNPLFLELYTPLLLHQITGNLIFQCSNIHTHTHLCTLHTLLFLLSSFSFYHLISISLTSI